MSSAKFERVKRRNPGIADLLDRIEGYIRRQLAAKQSYILPRLAAAALRLSDGEAFVLLEMLARGDVLQRVYNVYCRRNNSLIATVATAEQLDVLFSCDECGSEHDPSELKVEIAFKPKSKDFLDAAA